MVLHIPYAQPKLTHLLAPEKESQTYRSAAPAPAPEPVRTLSKAVSPQSFGSPPRKRLAKPAVPAAQDDDELDYALTGGPPRLAFPKGVQKGSSPLWDLSEQIRKTESKLMTASLCVILPAAMMKDH